MYLNNNLQKDTDMMYLKLLRKQFPTIESVSTEIINLQAILNLPKGTEFFLSDIHGEYEAFNHMLRSASGVIRHKINKVYGTTLPENEKNFLAYMIYYPDEMLEKIKLQNSATNDWYKYVLRHLVEICRGVCQKYTRSRVRKALPKNFSYVIEELLNEQDRQEKVEYYNEILQTIIDTERADAFIIELATVIRKLAVDRLHILGDIYDRGPGPDIIMDTLMEYSNSVDIQYGNHDILWLGASCGSEACIANAIRIAARYSNLDTIRDNYGINLLPLATFAVDTYGDDPCTQFLPTSVKEPTRDDILTSKMHKAITIIQLKLEAEIINRSFSGEMQDRLLLDKIDYENKRVVIDGKVYDMLDTDFPTVDPENPYVLTTEERNVIHKLRSSFLSCDKLQRHIKLLFSKGSMYKIYNSNLLYHGCIPLNDDGSMMQCKLDGEFLFGKAYIDKIEAIINEVYYTKGSTPMNKLDYIWYLWSGPKSPLFGKNKMATFERYFVNDKAVCKEHKNAYYKYSNSTETCSMILREFGLNPETSHIINGHVPVELKKGETPIKADGMLLEIDGGISKAYQPKTGIAGYTLISDSYRLSLISHEPFESKFNAILKELDIHSTRDIIEKTEQRKKVSDTDIGTKLKEEIEVLKYLLYAYKNDLLDEI